MKKRSIASDQVPAFRTHDAGLNSDFETALSEQGAPRALVFTEFMRAFVEHCREHKSLRFPFRVKLVEEKPFSLESKK